MAKIKILLVDDDADLINVMRMRIESWGCECLEALNGKDALASMKKKHPDIIILDYMMPDMDGLAVLKKIRRMDKKIPVIMFTAYPDATAIKGAEQLGVNAFIPKVSAYQDTGKTLEAVVDMIRNKSGGR
jgi:CheY-like chemotaxis protein